MAYPKNDGQFRTAKLAEVNDWGDRGWELKFEDGWCLSAPNGPITPEPGMSVRLYGRGIGYSVRGIFIDGHEFRYLTEQREREERQRRIAEKERADQARLEAEVAGRDARWAALPEVYQQRKARFETNNPTWRRDFEEYELFVCEQAHLIASALGTREAIAEFAKADWDEQKRRLPGLDGGHSGNTFGAACQLAAFEVGMPEGVVRQHGALSPLVGSRAYGDLDPERRVADAVMEGE